LILFDQHKTRSLLTVLGVVIGIMAIVAVASTETPMQAEEQNAIRGLGFALNAAVD
jgi:ABC-type antimicrobial peptide transport system permease subunit